MTVGVGAAPDIIHARGVRADPTHDPESFGHKDLSLVLFETGFCKDLGCQYKLNNPTEKYHPLLCALR